MQLCTKIISKVFVNRLKVYLPDLIAHFQSIFLTGRLIQDNIMVTHEIFHHLMSKSRSNKVYDLVEYEFLLNSLERMGFGAQWIKWMHACITTLTYHVIVNGRRTFTMQPSKGLRQGDPLSPYLFILLMNVLSRQVEKEVREKSCT